ncbi:hypothetical protein HMPREF3038_01028 [Akkermansia sp. KLE1797]|nr:hypothetical protein HMPREF3038_01028 [Akkermansia sp. KLE1797]KXU53391.1 hypothetical protein HMPREF3039_02392 [Akkermansia sp. KLE1798]KZA05069.1 hypothetical protein HMPREF1326_01288 [Akkermansia sp. KLE1605]
MALPGCHLKEQGRKKAPERQESIPGHMERPSTRRNLLRAGRAIR